MPPLSLSKPYAGFPLTVRQDGRLCKKIRGKIVYFGRIDAWQEALRLYLDQKDDLHAGRRPRVASAGPTLGLAMDHFLSAKKLLERAGEISPRSYLDYEGTCDRIAASLGSDLAMADIVTADLEKLRARLSTGKRGPLSPMTLKGELNRARMLFLYINENGFVERPIQYRKVLKSPPARTFRMLANERGPRMFEPPELKAMLAVASAQLQAMILLGVNCGFGNADCGTLPFSALDLDQGWHHYWRPKTHNPRRAPLWDETVAAIRAAIEERPEPAAGVRDFVFLTHRGECWCKSETGDNSISSEFRKLLKSIGLYRKNVTTFYSLRRTFETIGATAGDQPAVDYIMGHIAGNDDMASVYRQKTYDGPLFKVTNHVRAWLYGRKKIE